jgi:hypothetical protein
VPRTLRLFSVLLDMDMNRYILHIQKHTLHTYGHLRIVHSRFLKLGHEIYVAVVESGLPMSLCISALACFEKTVEVLLRL